MAPSNERPGTGTLCQRRRTPPPPPPEPPVPTTEPDLEHPVTPAEPGPDEAPTEITTPSGFLNALEPDEQRLVVFCCAMNAKGASALLEMAEPGRSARLACAAGELAGLDRSERIALFARQLSPPVSREVAQRALGELRAAPAWVGALASRTLPPEVREPLLLCPEVRARWEARTAAHPALESHVRRLAAHLLER